VDDNSALLTIVDQCSDALSAVHQLGVVHRDLKPTNIIVDGYPNSPHVWLLDFGMSKLREDSSAVTGAHAVLGAMGYMAPEQALGHSADADVRADVYALGALSYRMLTGRPPFDGHTLEALSHQIARVTPPPPSRVGVTANVDPVILAALSKRPEGRQASVALFARQLRAALAP
jgi:serine/threonine-protein kinase